MRAHWALVILLLAPAAGAQDIARLDVASVEAHGQQDGLGCIGAFVGLLHQRDADIPDGPTPGLTFSAERVEIERDRAAVVAAAGAVVPVPGASRTDRSGHDDATGVIKGAGVGHLMALLPQGPVTATLTAPHAKAMPSDGPVEAPAFVDARRAPLAADATGATRVEAQQATLTLHGDVLLVLWDWQLEVDDADGTHAYASGRSDQRVGAQGVEASEIAQVYARLHNATLMLTLPASPSALHLQDPDVTGAAEAVLHDALGTIGATDVAGADVVVRGDGFTVRLDVARARHIPVSLHGGIETVFVDETAVPLAAAMPASAVESPAWTLFGLAIVAAAVVAAAATRVGRRGPYRHRSLNLSEGFFERGWGRPMLWLAAWHLRSHATSPEGWKLAANAAQVIGNRRREAYMRERAARHLDGVHRSYNAMRLVILHAQLGNTDQAIAWLERCRQIDRRCLTALGSAGLSAELGRDARLRQAARQILGLEGLYV